MHKNAMLALLTAFASTTALADNPFEGPYAGVGVGYVDGQDEGKEISSGAFDGWTSRTDPTGSEVALFAGMNWLLGGYVVGIEGSYAERDADDAQPMKNVGVADPQYWLVTDLDAAFSLRGNLGYVFNENKTQAYLTVGYTEAKFERHYTDFGASQATTDRQYGWLAGVGVEHFFTGKVSGRAELRYADLGNGMADASQIYVGSYYEKHEYKESTLALGVAYHF